MGSVKVGTKSHFNTPNIENYKTIVVTVKSDSEWFPLGPYYLKNEKGEIFENIWQFHKVYKDVKAAKSAYSQRCTQIVWTWPSETHVSDDGTINPNYYVWKDKGLKNDWPVRYPLWNVEREARAFYTRAKPLYSLYNGEKLGLIEARKQIYFRNYVELIKKTKEFSILKNLLKVQNLLIVEWDGPQQKSLEYYIKKYNLKGDFIQSGTMDATVENLKIMLNDEKHCFGHGYCLAAALQDIDLTI